MTRQINAAAENLIKSFEGLALTAYADPVGIPTIGWGSTKGVQLGQTITRTQAENLLLRDLSEAEDAVGTLVKVLLNDNEFGALVSFAFNEGAGALKQSTLLRRLNTGDFAAVAEEIPKWNKAGRPLKVLPGLTRRRAAEARLFDTPEGAVEPSPSPPDSIPIPPVDGSVKAAIPSTPSGSSAHAPVIAVVAAGAAAVAAGASGPHTLMIAAVALVAVFAAVEVLRRTLFSTKG